jgi:hypothetical protein
MRQLFPSTFYSFFNNLFRSTYFGCLLSDSIFYMIYTGFSKILTMIYSGFNIILNMIYSFWYLWNTFIYFWWNYRRLRRMNRMMYYRRLRRMNRMMYYRRLNISMR